MKSLTLFIVLAAFCAGCATDDPETLKRAAREGVFPPVLDSHESAMALQRAFFAGGRVETVRVGLTRYLVIFRHGSGIPVTGIAVYRGAINRWRLVATPRPPGVEFFRVEAADGKIRLRGERSNQTWVIFDPNETPETAVTP